MSNYSYVPGAGGSPFGNLPANPQGSHYATASGYTTNTTYLLQKAIERAIYDAVPQQYYALKLLFQKPMTEELSDEFSYVETTFGRTALVTTATASAVSASAGNEVTQSVTFSAGSLTHVCVNDVVTYPDGTPGIVRSINTGTGVIVIASQTSDDLPAVGNGDIFAIQSTIFGDGAANFYHFDRLQTVERWNYIQFFLRAARWGRVELQKYQNLATTDYLDKDKQQKMTQLRTDLFVSFFNGTMGEFRTLDSAGNYIPAKAMGGVYPSMIAAGSMTANPTTAGLRTAFETLAFKTNFKQEGAVRFIYGTDEMLYQLSKVFKDPGIRYAPNDEIANMNLKEYVIGTQRFVPVPCELFKEQSCFPADWQRRILVLDQETITPVKMKGLPAMDMGSTLPKGERGTREAFQDFYVEANLSLKFNNPLASFILDVQ